MEHGPDRQPGASAAAEQMREWRESPQWSEATPRVEVSNPKGTFCMLDCSAVVGLPPEAVFDILCDTGNQRVFKNVKVSTPTPRPSTLYYRPSPALILPCGWPLHRGCALLGLQGGRGVVAGLGCAGFNACVCVCVFSLGAGLLCRA